MADDKKLSELPEAFDADNNDLLYIVHGDIGKKMAFASLIASTPIQSKVDEAELAANSSANSATLSQQARDAALLSRGVFASTANALSKGVAALASLVGGSGGTNGTFDLAFSGGGGTGAAGRFVVAGGVVVSVVITTTGHSYASAPTVSFAASSGLTGASAAAVIANNVDVGEFFSVPVAGADDSLILYRVDSGPAATEITRYPSSLSVTQPKWAGKTSGFIDPFFRVLQKGASLDSRSRWAGTDTGNSVSIVSSAGPFEGNALRKLGPGNLYGPVIWLDELGAVAGDTITLHALVRNGVTTGGAANIPFRAYTSAGAAVAAQVNAVPASGSAVLSANLQRYTLTYVTPANTAYMWFYPVTTAADKDLEVAALWGYKGVAADGPMWPIFGIDKFLSTQVSRITVDVSALDSRMDVVEGATTYAIDSASTVAASATSITLDGTGFSASPRDLVFMGWGEVYTPAGVSFNALRIKAISRTVGAAAQWRTLNIVVRTGANPQNVGAPVVAIGTATVIESLDSLTDVDVLLKDPATGAVKTLTDTDFSGGAYFIGVYARTAGAAPAACGEPRGTLANGVTSWYHTSTANNPVNGGWLAYTSNVRLGFQHLLLTSPAEVVAYSPSQQLANSLATSTATPAPEIVMPPAVFGVQGRECNVYFDNLHLADAADYLHDVTSAGAVGMHQTERWTWTPSAALTSGSLTVSAHDKRTGSSLVSKSALQRAAAATAGTGMTNNVIVIGDSLINAGTITQTLLDIAGTDVMGVALHGTRGTAPNKHEGRGGWTINDYATVGRTYRSFTVSGVSVSPALNATEYSDGAGTIYRVQEVALSGGSGSIVCSIQSGPNTPPASGTLTKTNGSAGDATIAFSSSANVSANPFWIGGQINFPQYLTNNSIVTPDWVFIALGINDVFGQTTDAAASGLADSAFTSLDTLITSIKAAGAGVKVGLILPTPPSSSQDSFGANYATGQTRWRNKRNVLIWARQLIAKYAGQEASRIYIVPSNTALDTVNNVSYAAAAPVNSRSTVTVARQDNGVHPAASGYRQIGDALWAFLKYYA